MLTELCQDLKNWFVLDKVFGTITISGGSITIDGEAPALLENQYFRIVGSVFNDGVHKYVTQQQAVSTTPPLVDNLTDETFEGGIWLMAIPSAVIKLATEIAAWRLKYEGADSAAMSPYNSESFGGYSYSKSTGGSASGATVAPSWKTVFMSRLNMWRKL